jgi:hypothetical protein
MKSPSLLSAIPVAVVWLTTLLPAQATDAEPAEQLAAAPSDVGVTTRGLTDEESILSQLRREGHFGGPQVGFELRVTKTEDGVLTAPVLRSFDVAGRCYFTCAAESLELRYFPKTAKLLVRMRNATGTTDEGAVGPFPLKEFQMEFPRRWHK